MASRFWLWTGSGSTIEDAQGTVVLHAGTCRYRTYDQSPIYRSQTSPYTRENIGRGPTCAASGQLTIRNNNRERMRIPLIAAAIGLAAMSAQARFVTLIHKGGLYPETLTISDNEAAIIAPPNHWPENHGVNTSYFQIRKDTAVYLKFPLWESVGGTTVFRMPDSDVVVQGPASIDFYSPVANNFLTVEIVTEVPPPDKTIVVPAGSGFDVQLEMSTDLINWETADPGAYDNTNGFHHLFFRIRATTLPH